MNDLVNKHSNLRFIFMDRCPFYHVLFSSFFNKFHFSSPSLDSQYCKMGLCKPLTLPVYSSVSLRCNSKWMPTCYSGKPVCDRFPVFLLCSAHCFSATHGTSVSSSKYFFLEILILPFQASYFPVIFIIGKELWGSLFP